ncbi:MAG TPA: 4-(cytidine 5'-diphospho)-2-C-methyl-D-erythritol kinase [Desulfobacterales bacterium]|nr:4-(cytidine 5'-diphospho)-2-C-methyl-D-erythritol kinase [Desulfobacterales bacterium]
MTEIAVKAPAKINLTLKVCGRRADGFHNIKSVMQKLNLTDEILLRKANQQIRLSCPGSNLPEDENNIAFKAAQTFFKYSGLKIGVEIELHKAIPTAAGLGGGSSDAAAVLMGLNKLFNTDYSPAVLRKLGAELGADVPFFITAGGSALATGTGTTLKELPGIRDVWFVLVNPGFSVSTKWVYDNFRLTTAEKPDILCGYSKSGNMILLPEDITRLMSWADTEFPFNDLEAVTAASYPIINDIKGRLLNSKAAAALMSGSGPTVFGIFANHHEAEICSRACRAFYPWVKLCDVWPT